MGSAATYLAVPCCTGLLLPRCHRKKLNAVHVVHRHGVVVRGKRAHEGTTKEARAVSWEVGDEVLRSPIGYVMDTPWSRARIAEGKPPLS
jgi:hypothetical protein